MEPRVRCCSGSVAEPPAARVVAATEAWRRGGEEEERRRGEVERHLVRLHEVEECPGRVPHFQQLELELVQRWDLEE